MERLKALIEENNEKRLREFYSGLSKNEKYVIKNLLAGKKLSEIAKKMNYSYDYCYKLKNRALRTL